MTNASLRIPPRLLYGDSMSTLMSALLAGVDSRQSCFSPSKPGYRNVLGYPLPAWQRPPTWTDEQNERFIQSVYGGVYLGLFIYNDAISTAPALDGLLIDGQQRLNAIERYVTDCFAVAGPTGEKFFWSQLTDEEKAHFYRINFSFQVVRISDEQQLKDLYNILNFGGTAHLPSQRA